MPQGIADFSGTVFDLGEVTLTITYEKNTFTFFGAATPFGLYGRAQVLRKRHRYRIQRREPLFADHLLRIRG